MMALLDPADALGLAHLVTEESGEAAATGGPKTQKGPHTWTAVGLKRKKDRTHG